MFDCLVGFSDEVGGWEGKESVSEIEFMAGDPGCRDLAVLFGVDVAH